MKTLKTITIVAIMLWVSVSAPVHAGEKDGAKGINFYSGTWSEALELAKKENKLIFLDISASWCGPCKMLKNNTFPNEAVGTFYNANFINIALDGEKGEGATLARKYGLTAYPTLIFIDGNGKLVAKTTGYHNAGQFLELGQKVIANK
ncbi:MAG: thioredoxin [Bacteroidetes bacterium HGW-Bacteroidetes-4]|jgi:thioredoxin-related protein|nr:MAG: thioredoxin [Bacteroidetes bacterium HGW-Bacteroidetes-4]